MEPGLDLFLLSIFKALTFPLGQQLQSKAVGLQ